MAMGQGKITRVKLMGNWCPPEQLCAEWDRMSQGNLRWNDIEVTFADVDVDIFVIINHPWPGERYVPERTLIFQMEPWCGGAHQAWGVKTWGEWANPDPSLFLQVRGHTSHLNNAFWQLRATYNELRTEPIRKTRILSSICSGKYFDPGHIKRVDFLKFIESRNDDVVRVELYAHDNPLGFESWIGPHPPDEKEAALAPYRYFFSAENNSEKNFITEKLWEPLLTETLCFYWGAPNAAAYVDPRAFIALDLDDFEQAFRTIKDAILNNEWEKRIEVIRREKRKVLDHYQFFPTLERILRHELQLPAHPSNAELRYHKYFGDALGESMRTVGFIHSYTRDGNCTILSEILDTVAGAGLLSHLDRLYIVNVGDDATLPDRLAHDMQRVRLINYSPDASRAEAPTLELIRTFSMFHHDARVLYVHTKGASYEAPSAHVADWRRMLLHFLVEKHDQARAALETHDVVGCNFLDHPARHFSGNFWWARASHLKSLPPVQNGERHQAEWWVLGTDSARITSLHNSGVNHYTERYARHRCVTDSPTEIPSDQPLLRVGEVVASSATRAHLCLCMIVKDEAHVVTETLASVAPHVDYWVIVDTGSSDDTIKVIYDFFLERGISGEIYQRAWVNFGTNRSEALLLARGKADYLWMIDADDLVNGIIDLSRLTLDSYLLRYGTDFRYWRKQIFRGNISWKYEGVLHEYPVCMEPGVSEGRLQGAYHIESRRLGNRSRAADKYQRDARTLLAEVQANPGDARNTFYLAQSLRDAGDHGQALEFYTRRAAMGGWREEVFYALLQRGVCMQHLGEPWDKVLAAHLRSWQFCPHRAEPLHLIASHYRLQGEFDLGHLFASRAKEILFPDEDCLFVAADVYEWKIRDELAICAYYLGRYRESLELCNQMLELQSISEIDRERIMGNRDFALSHLQHETVAYPADLIQQLAHEFAKGSRPQVEITLAITTCKRFSLFEQTVNSFLNCCADIDRIDRWICVDDGSSEAELFQMKQRYPFFEFIVKTREEKGHAHSMNSLLGAIKSPFWLHLEDDWHFVIRDRYVEKALAILDDDPTIGEVLFNRNYGETLACRSIAGGRVRRTKSGMRYRLHEHIRLDTPDYADFFRPLPPGTHSNVWWPHYSLRPALLRMSAIRQTGRYNPESSHFELQFAELYSALGHRSAFFDAINAVHIGKLTSENVGTGRPNAYQLNDEVQFGQPLSSAASRPFRVKLLTNWTSSNSLCALWDRQSKGACRWGDIEITDEDRDIDYWAVVNYPAHPGAFFRADRTIVFPMEPSRGVMHWGDWAAPDPRNFLQVRSHKRYRNNSEWHLGMRYEDLIEQPVEKSLRLSCVTSGKTQHPGQHLLTEFLNYIETSATQIDIFGRDNIHNFHNYRGPLPPYDKSSGIMPYGYTIAVENCAELNYFSEKLVDAILGECLCFYWGCPNLEDYIDPAAFIRLPLDDFELSLHIMEVAMRDNERARRLDAIRAEKRRILDEYQFFPTLARIIHGHRLAESLSIKVLNLNRRPDRWEAFRARTDDSAGPAFLARCERFAGVDGTTLSMTPEIQHLFRGNDFHYRRGIVGCALGHIAIWREVADRANSACLIFEDDAQPGADFSGQLVELCGELAETHADFDVVLLGYQFWNEPSAELAARINLSTRLRPMEWSNYLGGLHAYLISARGARRLLALIERDGIQNGIDWFVMKKSAELKILQCAPHIVLATLAIPGSTTDSDIQHDMIPVATDI